MKNKTTSPIYAIQFQLVSRIAERESEIALGLPHGSLSNGGLKQLVNININDLLALASAMPATEEEEPMNESNTGMGYQSDGGRISDTSRKPYSQNFAMNENRSYVLM